MINVPDQETSAGSPDEKPESNEVIKMQEIAIAASMATSLSRNVPNLERRLTSTTSSMERQRQQVEAKRLSPSQLARVKAEAHHRADLAEQVLYNAYYKTLFFGLKRNHEKKVALAYPVIFLLRRYMYILAILCITNLPFLAVILLMVACLAMIAMLLTEA